jgi:hypothetical protein
VCKVLHTSGTHPCERGWMLYINSYKSTTNLFVSGNDSSRTLAPCLQLGVQCFLRT